MKQKIFTILLTVLMSMVGTKTFAYDFNVKNADGVTIYYNYINDGKELEVTCREQNMGKSYEGVVVIPEEVTYMNHTRKVTSIGNYAFSSCYNLSFVNIPNSVNHIGNFAFSGCNITSIDIPDAVTDIGIGAFSASVGLSSTTLVLPKNLTSLGQQAFDFIDFPIVISKSKEPASISVISFSKSTFYNATLYVPVGTIDAYKAANGWSQFVFIEEGDGNGNNPTDREKCEKPTITYQNGKLIFYSSTEEAEYIYNITDSDIKTGNAKELQLGVTYNISVYATKTGYDNSEAATATLCWIDSEPKTEGITDGMAQMNARAVMVKTEGGHIVIEGAEDNTCIAVYTTEGVQVGSAVSENGVAQVNTNIPYDTIAIVKIGNKSIKVVMK